MERINSVAIDGPAGSGKGTVAKIVARDLGMMYIDTGAMYRCVCYLAQKQNIDPENQQALESLIDHMDFVLDEQGRVFVNGEDVTQAIRTPAIDQAVSRFASDPFVRKKLVSLQQNIAAKRNVVMEGRDICSVVLKNAKFKFYLDATAQTRAKRRYLQLKEHGNDNVSYEDVLNDINRRDHIDSTRQCDPLRVSEDALYIDSSAMSIEEVVALIKKNIAI